MTTTTMSTGSNNDDHEHACGNCGMLLACDGEDCEEMQRQITEACVQSDEMMMRWFDDNDRRWR